VNAQISQFKNPKAATADILWQAALAGFSPRPVSLQSNQLPTETDSAAFAPVASHKIESKPGMKE
jgi:hypothetical protein